MTPQASAMTGSRGEKVALCDVTVSAALTDLLSEVSITQTYRNDEAVNIEAVYTFPLALDAVLLELEVRIGERVLKGMVVEKTAAEERYEEAMSEGDTAVMLEAVEPGLYTMNVGNLLPGESATITYRYALLYRWAGDQLRFFLPTTIAPRYGAMPLLPHQVPQASLTVENAFSLQVEIAGSLGSAQFTCPSHAVTLAKACGKVVLSFKQTKAVMDRDFILNLKAPNATRSFVMCGADGAGTAAVASFQPFFPGLRQPQPLNLAIVVDCSGSMGGDSIEQARQALDGILEALKPDDRVSLVAFGNATKTLADKPLMCNKTNLAKARSFARQLQADMGGTEIGAALGATYTALSGVDAADIFLVTDGEVGSWQPVVEQAKQTDHRIFTVGVGAAVSEAFVRGLAEATGGECELVAPAEGMAERVLRHFERMRAPKATRVTLHWPQGAVDLYPGAIGAVFEGDTVIASARFDHAALAGEVTLEIETAEGDIARQALTIHAPAAAGADAFSTVARVAAALRLKTQAPAAGLASALRYRLMSPWTNTLVIAERADHEKALDLPALRKVPHTLAAGWGGTGRVEDAMCMSAPRASMDYSMLRSSDEMFLAKAQTGYADNSLIQRQMIQPSVGPLPPFDLLLELINLEPRCLATYGPIAVLGDAGLSAEFDDLFSHARDLGISVDAIATILLAELLGGPLRKHLCAAAKAQVKELQERAQRLIEALESIERNGQAIERIVEARAGEAVLQAQRADEIRQALGHLPGTHELLLRIKERAHLAVQRSRQPQRGRKSGAVA